MIKTKQEQYESHLDKMIADAPRLNVFEGTRSMYLSTRKLGHTHLLMQGVKEYLKDNFDNDKKVIIVLANDSQRGQFTILIEEDFPEIDLNRITFITIHQIRNLRGMEFKSVIVWDNFAIIQLAHEGVLARQNLTVFERLRKDLQG